MASGQKESPVNGRLTKEKRKAPLDTRGKVLLNILGVQLHSVMIGKSTG